MRAVLAVGWPAGMSLGALVWVMAFQVLTLSALAFPPLRGFGHVSRPPPLPRRGMHGMGLAMSALMKSKSEVRHLSSNSSRELVGLLPALLFPNTTEVAINITDGKVTEEVLYAESEFIAVEIVSFGEALDNETAPAVGSDSYALDGIAPEAPAESSIPESDLNAVSLNSSSAGVVVEVASTEAAETSIPTRPVSFEAADMAADLLLVQPVEAETPELDTAPFNITMAEMRGVLDHAKLVLRSSAQDLESWGWNLVKNTSAFALYKKPVNSSATEYMMTGSVKGAAPPAFLVAQVDPDQRARWDKSMREMSKAGIDLRSGVDSDVLYFRTKWPWPLKDRDYSLGRRCIAFGDGDSIVLVSKSVEEGGFPPRDGVVRVDKYWCRSAFVSRDKAAHPSLALDDGRRPPLGTSFVTLFCDDQRVPLPAKVTSLLAALAEQAVPESLSRLMDVAKDIQAQQGHQ